MKMRNFYVINLKRIIKILIVLILFMIIFVNITTRIKTDRIPDVQPLENISSSEEMNSQLDQIKSTVADIQEKTSQTTLMPYINMPEEIKGYRVIGKLEIDKINLSTYILETTSKDTLKLSVTKLYGPNVNQVGNFCITGHNYKNDKMFGRLKELKIDDEIKLIDIYNREVIYSVIDIIKVKPKEVFVLDQDTESGERELTLITCTAGALERLVVKAIEKYD